MRRRPIPALVSVGVATFIAVAAAAAPPTPFAPPTITPPKSGPVLDKKPAPVKPLPPTAKPVTSVTVSHAGIAPARGEDLSKAFIRRTFRGNGKCWVGKECVLIGRRFGDASRATPAKPFPRKMDLTRLPDGKVLETSASVWRDDLLIFMVKGPLPGRYSVAIRDADGRQVSSPYILELVASPKTPDADGDGVRGIESGGTDCDDLDPSVYPGAPESVDDEKDHDCNPNTIPVVDRDSDGEPDGLTCTIDVVGIGRDRVLEWTCGIDCDDGNSSIRNGEMKCDGRSPSNIFVCRGKRKSRVDPRTPVTGIWEPYSCKDFGGGTCVAQPNGTGSCR